MFDDFNFEYDHKVKADLADLWTATNYLGGIIEEYDVTYDAVCVIFCSTYQDIHIKFRHPL